MKQDTTSVIKSTRTQPWSINLPGQARPGSYIHVYVICAWYIERHCTHIHIYSCSSMVGPVGVTHTAKPCITGHQLNYFLVSRGTCTCKWTHVQHVEFLLACPKWMCPSGFLPHIHTSGFRTDDISTCTCNNEGHCLISRVEQILNDLEMNLFYCTEDADNSFNDFLYQLQKQAHRYTSTCTLCATNPCMINSH